MKIISIKNEINNINEILKELLLNNPSYKKSANERRSSKIYSGVKQYINGHLKANELSSMKKFTYGKTNSNGKIDANYISSNTSPFPSESSNKMGNSYESKLKNDFIVDEPQLLMNKIYKNNMSKDNNDDNHFFISQRNSNSNISVILNKKDI